MKIKFYNNLSDKEKKVIKIAGTTILVISGIALSYFIGKKVAIKVTSSATKAAVKEVTKLSEPACGLSFLYGELNADNEVIKAVNLLKNMRVEDWKITKILAEEGIKGLLKYAKEVRSFRGF